MSFPVQDFAREQSTSESDQQILLLVGFHQGKRLKFASRVCLSDSAENRWLMGSNPAGSSPVAGAQITVNAQMTDSAPV